MKQKGFWRKFLKMVLCFPVMPIFGVTGEGVTESKDNPVPTEETEPPAGKESDAEYARDTGEDQERGKDEPAPEKEPGKENLHETNDSSKAEKDEGKKEPDGDVFLNQLKTENKLFRAKIQPEFVEDAAILVMARVNSGAAEDEAIAGLKKRNPGWFEEKPPDGTGTAANPRNGTGGKEPAGSVGSRLAKQNRPKQESSFFKK